MKKNLCITIAMICFVNMSLLSQNGETNSFDCNLPIINLPIVDVPECLDCIVVVAGQTINVCDSDDDTDQLLTIFNNLTINQTVEFPPGVYILNELLPIDQVGVRILGQTCTDSDGNEFMAEFRFGNDIDPYGRTRLNSPDFAHGGRPGMINILADNVEIANMKFDQNYRAALFQGEARVCGDPATVAGINIGGRGFLPEKAKRDPEGVNIHDCVIFDTYADAITAFNVKTDNINISDNTVISTFVVQEGEEDWTQGPCNGVAIPHNGAEQGISVNKGTNIAIENNYLCGTMDDGIAVHAFANNVSIRNNTMNNSWRILVAGAHNAIVEGNTIINNASLPSSAIWVTGEFPKTPSGMADISSNVVIRENTITMETYLKPQFAIRLFGAGDDITIVDNTITVEDEPIDPNAVNNGIQIKDRFDNCNCEWRIGENFKIRNNVFINCETGISVGVVCPPKYIHDLGVDVQEMESDNTFNNCGTDVFVNSQNINAIQCREKALTCIPSYNCSAKIGSICKEAYELEIVEMAGNCEGAYFVNIELPDDPVQQECLGSISEADITWVTQNGGEERVVGKGQNVALPNGNYCVIVKSNKIGECFRCQTIACIDDVTNGLVAMEGSVWAQPICVFGEIAAGNMTAEGQVPGSICLLMQHGMPPFKIQIDKVDAFRVTNVVALDMVHERSTQHLFEEGGNYCITVSDACDQVFYECFEIDVIQSSGEFCDPILHCLTNVDVVSGFGQIIEDFGNDGNGAQNSYDLSESISFKRMYDNINHGRYELFEKGNEKVLGWINLNLNNTLELKQIQMGAVDFQVEALSVLPNPSKGDLTIRFQASAAAVGWNTLTLKNISGQKVYEADVLVGKGLNLFSVQTREVGPGLYFLRVGNKLEKIMITN